MPATIEDLRPHLRDFDFEGLFIEQLGWNHFQSRPLQVEVRRDVYTTAAHCREGGVCGRIRVRVRMRMVPFLLTTHSRKSSIGSPRLRSSISSCSSTTEQSQASLAVGEARTRQVAQAETLGVSSEGQPGDSLLQPLQNLAFDLDDEAKRTSTISEPVTDRARRAFDVEKVTKRFYLQRFRTELTAFQGFIEGITDMGDRDWYASLMLNRMMFVYFIQKRSDS